MTEQRPENCNALGAGPDGITSVPGSAIQRSTRCHHQVPGGRSSERRGPTDTASDETFEGIALWDAICVRITADGRIRALWDDRLALHTLGPCRIRRASHVEFDERRQRWYVQEATPVGLIRRALQLLTGLPMGRVLFTARTRAAALRWEARHFGPGGAGWAGQERL